MPNISFNSWQRILMMLIVVGGGCAADKCRVTGTQSGPALSDLHLALTQSLEQHVRKLASDIGMRDKAHPVAERVAAEYIEAEFRSIGDGRISIQSYEVEGATHRNVCFEVPGSVDPDQIVVVGAHYDTAVGTPGADDNASGVAALIELARRFAAPSPPPQSTIRFVAFSTEEPPAIRTPHMGSYNYARRCRESDEKIVAMMSIEMIGYFSDERGSQRGPFPSVGNFLLFAGHTGNGRAIKTAQQTFLAAVAMPAEVIVLPEQLVVHARVPLGANSSDQWSFWQFDYPGIMATDTANWRNPHYHHPTDTPEKLSYDRMATAVEGLEACLLYTSPSPRDS